MTRTKVIFRHLGREGVIALLTQLPADESGIECAAYTMAGLCAASYPAVVAESRPALPHEYWTLKSKVEAAGYRSLIIATRSGTNDLRIRHRVMAAQFNKGKTLTSTKP